MTATGHRLERVSVWLPGPEPTGYRPSVASDPEAGHWIRFLRCRDCGAERERASDFQSECHARGTRSRVVADD